MHNQTNIIYLDRDGVINEKAKPHDYIKTWDEFTFLPGVFEALQLFAEQHYKIVIITNQRGIARGMMTKQDVEQIHEKMCQEIRKHNGNIDGIYICPHDYGECDCRKPQIGLFLQAEQTFLPNKEQSWMIGDSPTDIEAGKKYQVHTIYLGTKKDVHADHICSTLLEAAIYITQGGTK